MKILKKRKENPYNRDSNPVDIGLESELRSDNTLYSQNLGCPNRCETPIHCIYTRAKYLKQSQVFQYL